MFEINQEIKIKKENLCDSFIYTIDNFYQSPEEVLNLFLSSESFVFKKNEKPSYNQLYFDDSRNIMHSEEIKQVYEFLSKICNQKPFVKDTLVQTNLIRFYCNNFNNYQSNYWWPHEDVGYTGILYLNKNDEEYGTNLYEIINHEEEPPKDIPEHFQPWRKKSNFKLIKTIKPKFNRMVLYDGHRFPHGMNICGDKYFGSDYRMNQVFFFKSHNIHTFNDMTYSIVVKYH